MWLALFPLAVKLIMGFLGFWGNRKLHKLETELAEARIETKLARQQAAAEIVHRELAVSQAERKMKIAGATHRRERKDLERRAKKQVGEMSHGEVLEFLRGEGLLR